ncbi:hypothetical protein ACET3X_004607 [Alternaria dauci]|uniref:Zn(2)-C6 fungal-type domain-containing protein n=1 Tax=Alternaria dauci TaxID=48095 RepID=A0ABR3UNE6_9PLEO
MVYRGKPSTACAECRRLRSRCDKKLPACGQCTKAGRACSGYRATVDLMFLDESTRVVSQNQAHLLPQDTDLDTPKGRSRLKGQLAKRPVAQYPLKLTEFIMYQPLNDLGVNFFMTNFIVDDPAMSLLDYLPGFYAKTADSAPALSQICAAVGLVGLVNKSHNRDMLSAATHNYGAAIRAINKALRYTKTAVKDCTVASIYLAAMFEALVIPRRAGMDNAGIHLAGAVSVAHMVLKQQEQTDVTVKLCNTLMKTVIMNCWIQNVPLSPNFIDFKRLVEKKAERVLVDDSFLDVIVSLLQFKEEYQKAKKADPTAIVQRALAIDTNLDAYARDLAQKAPLGTDQLPDADDIGLAHKGYFHLRPQHLHAHIWNSVQTTHIRLHQAILRQCDTEASSLDPETQRTSAKKLIVPKIVELLARVPQLAGHVQDIHGTSIRPTYATPTSSRSTSPDQELYERGICTSISQSADHGLHDILHQLYINGSEPCILRFTKDWIQQ